MSEENLTFVYSNLLPLPAALFLILLFIFYLLPSIGYYKAGNHSMTVCERCKHGYYQTRTGSNMCNLCPAGHFCQVCIPQTP